MTAKMKPVENPAPLPAAPVQDAANMKTAGTACVSVVIPYCKEYAQGNELLFALRSWYQNARFPFRIVIIGDAEEWMDGENLTLIECPRCSDIPSVDTLHKLWTAQESPEVTGGFIWTNDDIYLMNPVGLEHIQLAATALGLGACWANQPHWLTDVPGVRAIFMPLGLRPEEDIFGSFSVGRPARPMKPAGPRKEGRAVVDVDLELPL